MAKAKRKEGELGVTESDVRGEDGSGPSLSTTVASPLSSKPKVPPSPFPPIPSKMSSFVPEDHFYEILLDSIEKLFDNEIEQSTFEDLIRGMFGVEVTILRFPLPLLLLRDVLTFFFCQHSYKAYTIDKLIGAIIKQVSPTAVRTFVASKLTDAPRSKRYSPMQNHRTFWRSSRRRSWLVHPKHSSMEETRLRRCSRPMRICSE